MAKSAEIVSCVLGERIVARKVSTTKATEVVCTYRVAKTSATFMASTSSVTTVGHRRRRGDNGRDC